MDTRNASMDWIAQPHVALGVAAMTVAVALIAFFVMVVQENVQRGAERRHLQALGLLAQAEVAAPRRVHAMSVVVCGEAASICERASRCASCGVPAL